MLNSSSRPSLKGIRLSMIVILGQLIAKELTVVSLCHIDETVHKGFDRHRNATYTSQMR